MDVWAYYVGRFLEAVALGLLAYALVYGLATGDLRSEFRLFAAGVLTFLVGRVLERWGARRS